MLKNPPPWLLHSQRRRIRQRGLVLSSPAQKRISRTISVGSELKAPPSNAIATDMSGGFNGKKTFGLRVQRRTVFAAIADWYDSAHFKPFTKRS
jgi:hypothetical protein